MVAVAVTQGFQFGLRTLAVLVLATSFLFFLAPTVGFLCAGLVLIVTGTALLIVRPSDRKLMGLVVVMIACVAIMLAELARNDPARRQNADRSQCEQNLRQIAAGLKLYAALNESIVPIAVKTPEGVPLLSWRVLLLDSVSNAPPVRVDRPWNSDENNLSRPTSPKCFRCPGDSSSSRYTSYVMVRDNSDILDKRKLLPDHICVVELRGRFEWMQPEDPKLLPTLQELMRTKEFFDYHGGVALLIRNDGTIETIHRSGPR